MNYYDKLGHAFANVKKRHPPFIPFRLSTCDALTIFLPRTRTDNCGTNAELISRRVAETAEKDRPYPKPYGFPCSAFSVSQVSRANGRATGCKLPWFQVLPPASVRVGPWPTFAFVVDLPERKG